MQALVVEDDRIRGLLNPGVNNSIEFEKMVLYFGEDYFVSYGEDPTASFSRHDIDEEGNGNSLEIGNQTLDPVQISGETPASLLPKPPVQVKDISPSCRTTTTVHREPVFDDDGNRIGFRLTPWRQHLY
jgi:hypothetical protein